MARRTKTFENVKFFTKRMLRKYTTSRGVLLDQNQKKLTFTNVNEDDNTSFRRKGENNGLISTQQLPVDNSLFQNNTFFGSAEAKINVAFDKIINKYPFDGSLQEVEVFEDSLSSLEKYVLDRFPKSKGFLTFVSDNNQYITVEDKSGKLSQSLLNGEQGASYINPELNPFSIEMAIRLPEETNQKSFVCHSVNPTLNTGFAVFLDASASTKNGTINFAIVSGSNNYASASYTMDKGRWYNLSFFYDNTNEQQTVNIVSGSNVLARSDFFNYPGLNTLNAALTIGDGNTSFGAGHLNFEKSTTFSGSIDEFRVFHGVRTSDEIEYYSKRNIFSHENLRLCLRFNEPTGSYSNNDVVLDHSGNSLHSRITNFTEDMRHRRNLPDPTFLEDSRFSPVLFPNFPDVIDLNSELLEMATEYDINNPNLITKLVPNHYLQEGAYLEGLSVDGDIVENYSSTGTLPKAGRLGHAQLMSLMLYYIAEELDQYKMYIDQVSQFLHPDYSGKDGTADAFLPDLAKYYGLELPKIFGDASFEQYLGKENLGLEYSTYERSLSEVQNLIWRRVLKNVSHIFKSKGTKYAIETIFRSAGIEPGRIFRLVEFNGVNEFRMGLSRQQITEMSTILNFSGSLDKFPEVARLDGTLEKRPTLLTAPLTASRIETGFPEISGGNVLASASIYFHPSDSTAIPPEGTQITIQDAFNKTEVFKFLNVDESVKAFATVSVTNGSAAPGLAEADSVTLESISGKTRKYVLVDATTSGVATGTIIGVGTDLGSRVVVARTNAASLQEGREYRILSTGGTTNWQSLGASSDSPKFGDTFVATAVSAAGIDHGEVEEAVVGGIAVSVALTGTPANGNTFLTQLKNAIDHENGHGNELTVTGPAANAITITQIDSGNVGNKSTSSILTGGNTAATNFSGGLKTVNRRSDGSDKKSFQLIEDLNTAISTAFSSTMTTKTGYRARNNNKDVLDLNTINFSRSNLGNHSVAVSSTKAPALWVRMSSTAPTNKGTLASITPEYQPRGSFAEIEFTGNPTINETITLVSTDGTSLTYSAKSAGNSTYRTFDCNNGPDVSASTLRDAILDSTADTGGHAGKILVVQNGGKLTLTQATIGSVGSTAITSNLSNTTITSRTTSEGGGTGFTGNPMAITTQAVTAKASFSVFNASLTHGMTAGQKITIKSDNNIIVDYFISDTSNGSAGVGHVANLGTVANGAALGDGVTASLTSGATGIAIAFNVSATTTTQADFLALFRQAILAGNHRGILHPSVISNSSFSLLQGSFDNSANATITSNIANLIKTNFVAKTRNINAVAFDGFNDSISIGTASQWNEVIGNASASSKKMSFCMWVYKSSDGENDLGRIFDFGDGDIFLYTTASELLAFNVKLNNSLVEWRTDAAYFTLNSWNHIAITYDATNTASNDPVIYINGMSRTVSVASGTKHATFSGISTEACFLGNNAAESYSFEGKIGEFQVYRDVLTSDEVNKIYNAETDESIPPFISADGFGGGNGFVRANTLGYEYNGVSATKDDGLLTSGSWTVEGIYQFSSTLSKEDRRSLSRLVTQGSTTGQNWEDKHAVLSNLVLSPFGDQLSLYVRNRHHNDAPTLVTELTGANCLDGRKWYIAYGRQRNDEASQPVSSSYFIRAAALDYGEVKTYISKNLFFDEGDPTSNMFQSSKHLVSPGTYEEFRPVQILIGSQSMVNGSVSGKFLNDTSTGNVPFDARTTYFDGRVGHLRFWSKALSEDESKEHARNFKSVGVDSPLVNNTFSISHSGSFQKLRLNVSTDQVSRETDNTGRLDLLDFSQTFTPANESKIQSGAYTSMSGAICFGFEPYKKIVENSRFDYSIISPFYDEYLDSDKIKIAGFSDGPNIKLYNSKISPVTEILPFEKEVNDNRFEIQVHLQRGLDEDIMNIFSTIDALDDALGKPELVFAQEYPDLRKMRHLYFNRLTDKVNYRNFFDLFRWLDDAFSDMVEKFVPRNSDFLGINLIIESHALERYKVAYGHQEIYKGEDERAKLRSKILVSQRSGVLRRF